MIYSVYSVRDILTGFGVPIVQDNDAVAIRAFENGCKDPSSTWHSHPADFTLECIGDFDTETGELIPVPVRRICSAADFVEKKEVFKNES